MVCLRAGINIYRGLIFPASISEIIVEFCVLSVVTYLLASEKTVNREFGAYDRIRDNFPKYVVSLDELDMSRNGIKHRNIRDFLLTEEWN